MAYRELSVEEFNDLASEDNHLLVVNKKVCEIVQGDKTSDEPLTETYKAFIAQRDAKPGQVFMPVESHSYILSRGRNHYRSSCTYILEGRG